MKWRRGRGGGHALNGRISNALIIQVPKITNCILTYQLNTLLRTIESCLHIALFLFKWVHLKMKVNLFLFPIKMSSLILECDSINFNLLIRTHRAKELVSCRAGPLGWKTYHEKLFHSITVWCPLGQKKDIIFGLDIAFH